ncbi:MAG TPA: hypothetical protein VFI57_05830 [Pyrinomonadaceae bacterium]|nr:hypothetical protein [Pyrinomonadaceae bacterium]
MFPRITLAAATVLLKISIGFACTCGPNVSVLDEYDRSQVVLIAHLSAIQKVEQTQKEVYVDDDARSQLVVEKVYKGDVRARDALVFAQGNGVDCAWRFSDEMMGQRFLFYLRVPPAGSDWRVSSCGRSKSVKRATEDLLYLDKMDEVRGQTRVSGRYAGGFYGGELKVAGRTIRIVGDNGTFETKTDENGIFEIYNLKPGDYRLEPELSPGLKVDTDWLWMSSAVVRERSSDTAVAFKLEAHKHVSIDLGFKLASPKTVRPQ